MAIIKITALDGSPVEFEDKKIGEGGMKDVYFSPDKKYVVAFFRDKQDANSKERLKLICGKYRENIFNQAGGEYWNDLYCWPTKIVEYNGLWPDKVVRLGVVAPVYKSNFFFKYGSKNNDANKIKGKEKEGAWFAKALNQNRTLDSREKGNWLNYFSICIKISRAVRRMHAAGLAHSDLSYKNVLVDPETGNAAIIDIDGLVVPGRFPPGVIGTPDFIAPEVMETLPLKLDDKLKNLPKRETDQHALAVLIYMYLLYRNPLRGKQVHDMNDDVRDESLTMGEKALFIEHSSNKSNRYDAAWVKRTNSNIAQYLLPWWDLDKLPYTILGPYLKDLVKRAFEDGLHNPAKRPSADDWETALVKTVDLMQPCANTACEQKWFVFDNSSKPKCPFCGTPFKGQLPILNFYSKRGSGDTFGPDNHRLMVYNNQYLYQWHVNKKISANERLTPEQKKPVGYFAFHQNKWVFINQTLTGLKDVSEKKDIKQKEMVELTDGKQILLSGEEGGRLIQVQLVTA